MEEQNTHKNTRHISEDRACLIERGKGNARKEKIRRFKSVHRDANNCIYTYVCICMHIWLCTKMQAVFINEESSERCLGGGKRTPFVQTEHWVVSVWALCASLCTALCNGAYTNITRALEKNVCHR